MTKEQIEQAAKEYAEKNERYEWQGDGSEEECAFIAGAESRQAEIDELIKSLEQCRIWVDAFYRATKNSHVEGDFEPLREAAEKAEAAIRKAKGGEQ